MLVTPTNNKFSSIQNTYELEIKEYSIITHLENAENFVANIEYNFVKYSDMDTIGQGKAVGMDNIYLKS